MSAMKTIAIILFAVFFCSPLWRMAKGLLDRRRDRRRNAEEWRRLFAAGLTSKRLDEWEGGPK